MGGYALFITHRTLPGQREAVRDVWMRHLAPAIVANAGHHAYFYCFDVADPDVLRVFQLYANEQASSDFLVHPSYKDYLADVECLLSGPPEVNAASPQWQKPDDAQLDVYVKVT